MTPNLTDSLDQALNQAIQNLFNNLIANLASPVFSPDKSTPISRFEAGFKLALQAYEQASAVVEKQST